MFGVVAPAQVWTLANYVLTTREAKRLYGFIGSGAIAGESSAATCVKQRSRQFGAESTLVGMAVALLLCAVHRRPALAPAAPGAIGDPETRRRARPRARPAGLLTACSRSRRRPT